MVRLLDRDVAFTIFRVGMVVSTISFVLIFHVESQVARNILGFLIGSGFSPAFTSESSGSNRYFALCFALIAFEFMILAGFRWSLIIAFFVLALSALSEAEGRAALELAARSEEKEEE